MCTVQIKDEIYNCRYDNTSNSSKHGKRSLAGVTQLPYGHFILKLDTYQHEENGHQKVIDKLLGTDFNSSPSHTYH